MSADQCSPSHRHQSSVLPHSTAVGGRTLVFWIIHYCFHFRWVQVTWLSASLSTVYFQGKKEKVVLWKRHEPALLKSFFIKEVWYRIV
jgi:hypothetical protein